MIWLSRLPKDHGKSHGRNRHDQPGTTVSKHQEVEEADRADEAEYTKADMPARPRWKGLQICARSTAPDALADVLRESAILPPRQRGVPARIRALPGDGIAKQRRESIERRLKDENYHRDDLADRICHPALEER
jgi:hypothetical protein